MTNETILVVDAGTKSQKVLEISFKKAGYRVIVVDSVSQARQAIAQQTPDLIVSETQFAHGGEDGFAFCKSLKTHPSWRQIPFVFLSEQSTLPEKMYGLEQGADEYLTKPIYIKEVTNRVEVLLQKRAQGRLSGAQVEEFRGDLADVTMIDLLQTIEQEQRSGSLRIQRAGREGAVYFSQGNILDATCDKLRGEDALYRLMLWPDGEILVQYHAVGERADHVAKDSGALLLEGIRRLEQWNELAAGLPELEGIFEADYQRLPGLLASMPEEASRLVRLFDGIRSLYDIVSDSPFNDIVTLQIMARLFEEDILRAVGSPASGQQRRHTRSNLEAWLAGGDERGDVRRPFAPVDPESDTPSQPLVRPRLERSGGSLEEDTGGHWTVRWSTVAQAGEDADSAQDAPATGSWAESLEELNEREARRREEEAKHLIRESGRFDAVPQLSARAHEDQEAAWVGGARRTTMPIEPVGRTTMPIESIDRQQEDADAPRRRRLTPIATPNAIDEDVAATRASADQTSPGIQIARLLVNPDELDEPEVAAQDAPAAAPADEAAKESAATPDSSEFPFALDVTPLPASFQAAEQPAEAPAPTDRRAAALDEAAAVTREASQNMRDSAPVAAISRYEEDEADLDDEFMPAKDADGRRARRKTAQLWPQSEPAPAQEGAPSEESPQEAGDMHSIFEGISEAGAEDDAASGVGLEESTADVQPARSPAISVPSEAITPLAETEPGKVERTAVDRKMVRAEYYLGEAPTPRDGTSVRPLRDTSAEPGTEAEADIATADTLDKPDAVEDDTLELERNASKPADAAPGEAAQPEAGADAKAGDDAKAVAEDATDKGSKDKGSKVEGSKDKGAEDKGSKDKGAEDKGAQKAGTGATKADEKSDDEVALAAGAHDAGAGEMGLSDESDFFSNGDEGEYGWQFDDVPPPNNRWKYFTAVAIFLGLTALVLAVFVVSPSDEHPAGQVAQVESPSAAKPEAPTPAVAAAPAQPTGLDPAAAAQAASKDAHQVQQTAQGAAMLLAGEAGAFEDAAPDPAEAASPLEDEVALAVAAPDDAQPADQAQPAEEAAADSGSAPVAQLDTPPAAKKPADAPAAPAPKAAPAPQEAARPAAPAREQGFDARLAAAEAKVNAGQNSQALTDLRQLSAEQAGNAKVAYLHGVAALGSGNYSEAARQLARADQLGYGNLNLYMDLAAAHQLNGDVGKAREAYQKFLSRQPTGKRADEVRSILERL